MKTKKTDTALIGAIKSCGQMSEQIESIADPLFTLIFKLSVLPNRELAQYFIDSDDLQKLEAAHTVLEQMQQGFHNEAVKAAKELTKRK